MCSGLEPKWKMVYIRKCELLQGGSDYEMGPTFAVVENGQVHHHKQYTPIKNHVFNAVSVAATEMSGEARHFVNRTIVSRVLILGDLTSDLNIK